MSELLRRRPAYEPIRTKGNQFFREDERFLIKGINYFKKRSSVPSTEPHSRDPTIDCLDDAYLPELRRDIEILQELGLNTLSVSHLDPGKSHHQAFKLLAAHGFYIILHAGNFFHDNISKLVVNDSPDFSSLRDYYTATIVGDDLKVIAQIASYPNLLGLMVSGSSINTARRTKNAELVRAYVRDIKTFLHRSGERSVPVGVSFPDVVAHRKDAMQYFSAGSPETGRADFFGLDCYSWVSPSDFRVSGWKNLVEKSGSFPMPMFLSSYGAHVFERMRIWQEVECLYSPDMTGVFSGGCLQCFMEYGNGFGIVEEDEDGGVKRKLEFEDLRGRFRIVNGRSDEDVAVAKVKEYEGWRGQYPTVRDERGMGWFATDESPELGIDWKEFIRAG